jgi:hypothetical protein
MKELPEMEKAVSASSLVGKKLKLVSMKKDIDTAYGKATLYTVVVNDGDKETSFFGGKGINQQDMQVGDVFALREKDVGKGNPMVYAEAVKKK